MSRPATAGRVSVKMTHVLWRFGQQRGAALSRPVASNRRLQSYRIDRDFAAAASGMFGERMPDQQSSGLMRP